MDSIHLEQIYLNQHSHVSLLKIWCIEVCLKWKKIITAITEHEFHETCHSVVLFHEKDSKRCCDTTTPESIHAKDESKRGSVFAFIFGVNWLWRCGVTASFGVFFHEIKYNGLTSFMEYMNGDSEVNLIISSTVYRYSICITIKWGDFNLIDNLPSFQGCKTW